VGNALNQPSGISTASIRKGRSKQADDNEE